MSDWTPIQFVPLECTAIRLHQIFKEWPLYFGEMTTSIFLSHTNLHFLISFSAIHFLYSISLSTSTLTTQDFTYGTTTTETLQNRRSGITRSWWVVSHNTCCYQSYKLPSFPSDHLDELTGCARENPSTDKALYPACFLKDTSCPLNEEGNWTSPFHGGRMSAFEMRHVWVCASVWLWCICLRAAMTDNRSEKQKRSD